MADIDSVLVGIATNLRTLDGVQVTEYELPNPTPPTLALSVGPSTYDMTMGRGHDDLTVIIRAYVGVALTVPAIKRLNRFLDSAGEESVKKAAETDTSLGGIVDDIRVIEHGGHLVFTRQGQAPLLGAEWTVLVRNPGTE